MSPTSKPIILITGGNTGLGLETVKALLRSGQPYEIIIGSRSSQKGEEAINELKREFSSTTSTLSVLQVDIASDDSITTARDTLTSKHSHLDVLINNAGANMDGLHQSGKLSLREAWNRSWDVNVSGTMVLTSELVPLLLKSSDPRLIFLASGTSSLSETERFDTKPFQFLNGNPAKGWPKPNVPNPTTMYRSVKTGLNMAMKEWHRVLKEDGVKVWGVSPGFLATGLAGIGAEQLKKMGAIEPSVGAEFVKDVVQGKRDEDVGKVIRKDMVQPY